MVPPKVALKPLTCSLSSSADGNKPIVFITLPANSFAEWSGLSNSFKTNEQKQTALAGQRASDEVLVPDPDRELERRVGPRRNQVGPADKNPRLENVARDRQHQGAGLRGEEEHDGPQGRPQLLAEGPGGGRRAGHAAQPAEACEPG